MVYGTVSVCLFWACIPLQPLPRGKDRDQTPLWVQSVFEKGLVIHRVKSLARVYKSSFWQRGRVCCMLAVHGLDTCIQGFHLWGTSGNAQMSTSWFSKQDYCLAHRTTNCVKTSLTERQERSGRVPMIIILKNRLLKIQAALAGPCAKNIHICVLFDEYTFLHSICQVYDCSVIWAALSLMITIKFI